MLTGTKLKSIAGALFISLALTACDPPMPESLRVSQAELQVQCEDGDVSVVIPASIADLGFSWSDSLLFACEVMNFLQVDDTASEADIVISEQSLIAGRCSPFATVPVAIDAAVLVVNIPDFFEVFLSAQQIIDIFNGTITNWSDPALAEFNGDFPLPDLDIVLPTEATVSAKAALSEWISRLAGSNLDLSGIADATDFNEIGLATPEQEGAISIASYGAAGFMISSMVAVVADPENPESYIRPDYASLLSAKTQLTSSLDGSTLSVALDPTIEPTPEEGLTDVVPPYQAVYATKMALCGEDTTLIRTLARYLLRQDSQGVIAAATMMPLPEAIRIEAIQIVIVGLPVPTPAATLETDEG